jgi:hypothetical protein
MTRREKDKDKNDINWGKDEAQIYQDKTKTSTSSCKSVFHGREWHIVIHGREKNENPDQKADQKQGNVQRGWKELGSRYSTNSDAGDLCEIMKYLTPQEAQSYRLTSSQSKTLDDPVSFKINTQGNDDEGTEQSTTKDSYSTMSEDERCEKKKRERELELSRRSSTISGHSTQGEFTRPRLSNIQHEKTETVTGITKMIDRDEQKRGTPTNSIAWEDQSLTQNQEVKMQGDRTNYTKRENSRKLKKDNQEERREQDEEKCEKDKETEALIEIVLDLYSEEQKYMKGEKREEIENFLNSCADDIGNCIKLTEDELGKELVDNKYVLKRIESM